MTRTFKIRQRILINTNWNTYIIDHAPDGGRTEYQGPIHGKPFAFINPVAHVIDNYGGTAAEFKNADRVEIGEIIDIEGYGLHEILKPGRWDSDSISIKRLEDGFITSGG